MLSHKFNFLIITTIFSVGMLWSQEYSGEYVIQTENGMVILTLKANSEGIYRGSLSGGGNTFLLQGMVQNGILTGSVGSEGIIFQARLTGNYLTLSMAETDRAGNPINATVQTLIFQRRSAGQGKVEQQKQGESEQVIINGVALNAAQVREFKNTYGIEPKPGNYWYDAKSGLYGVVGYPAFGFMLPGHNFGIMDSKVSNGNTGIFVNGRELPMSEYTVWSYIVGNWIQPGRYWLDGKGNAGYEGSPIPIINLYVAARQNAYRGQGSGGDNFWSTRFSAGNSNANNTQGYVSVPGYGPIGYGF